MQTLLLESFPVPPSFIPPSPVSPNPHLNPPPSRPPSSPLPPVPGPSRISQDAVYFLGSRNSRYSAASRPDSIASTASARSNGAHYASSPNDRRPDSVIMEHTDDDEESVFDPTEAYGGTVDSDGDEQLTKLSISVPPEEDDKHDTTPLSAQFPVPPPLSNYHIKRLSINSSSTSKSTTTEENSLSSISMNDLPIDDDSESDIPTTTNYNIIRITNVPKRLSLSSSTPTSSLSPPDTPQISHTPPTPQSPAFGPSSPFSSSHPAVLRPRGRFSSSPRAFPGDFSSNSAAVEQPSSPLIPSESPITFPTQVKFPSESSPVEEDPLQLHRELRQARSRSASHKRRLRQESHTPSPGPSTPQVEETPSPVLPQTQTPARAKAPPSSFRQPTRSGSPDIGEILEKTPRPRRRSSASVLSASKSRSSLASASSGSGSRRSSSVHKLERELEGVGSDEEPGFGFGYGDGLDEGSASDSSLDIHTPLPHLMLRHGQLSHKSKVLPNHAASTDSLLDSSRPASTMSLRSSDSKLLKDTRDTPSRRLRHKDGRLLRGGLGLTTGLGWSDSEDEDAPSPLTRRISSLSLSRKPSFGSLGSNRSTSSLHGSKSYGSLSTSFKRSTRSSLSRSVPTAEMQEQTDSEDEYNMLTFRSTGSVTGKLPPSAWQKGTQRSSSRTSSRKTGRSSTGSNTSLAISIPDSASMPAFPKSARSAGFGATPSSAKSITRSVSETSMSLNRRPRNISEEQIFSPSSPSSISSVSMNMPSTPKDEDISTSGAPVSPGFYMVRMDSNKMLPPLPNPRTGSIRRPAAPGLAARFNSPQSQRVASEGVGGRSRAVSTGQTLGSSTSLPNINESTSLPSTVTSMPLRQLQLPRYSAMGSHHTPSQVQPGVPRSPPTTPKTPITPTTSSKPRTGTGMVYRSSSGSGNGGTPSMLRKPSSSMLRQPQSLPSATTRI